MPVIAEKWLRLAEIDDDGDWVNTDTRAPLDVEMWYDLPMPDWGSVMADQEAERTSLDQYERYMNREPLNDELRAVQRGETLLVEPAHPVDKAVAAVEREKRPGLLDWTPSRAQLADLKETVAGEGWPILMRLLEKRLEIAREAAITMSQKAPLENQVEIAKAWAYHGIMKRVVTEIEPAVKEQLERLRKVE